MNEAAPQTSSGSKEKTLTAEKLIERLCRSLKRDGDFPASAKVVTELRKLAGDPRTTANQITEIILHEPSLGIRILHVVNSTFYRRSTPIMTVSQAVVRIGMRQLAELCAGLVLLQKFVPSARKDGAFAACLRKAIITPLLSSQIATEMQPAKKLGPSEGGYLAGMFAELGTLLLAYYFPQMYDSAVKRAEQKNLPLAQSLKEITGVTPFQISAAVIKALELPEFYLKVLEHAENGGTVVDSSLLPTEIRAVQTASQSVFAATAISEVITNPNASKGSLDAVLAKIQPNMELDLKGIQRAISKLPEVFEEHCQTIEIDLPVIPTYVHTYSSETVIIEENPVHPFGGEDNFSKFVEEIRQAVESHEPTASIITTVMETLAWGLNFERVVLLLLESNKKTLRGRMCLGDIGGLDPRDLVRPLGREAGPYAPDAQSFDSARVVFQGEPVLENGWPFAAIPVGFGTQAIGVIYADRINSSVLELGHREQAAIGVLAELLDRSITMQSK